MISLPRIPVYKLKLSLVYVYVEVLQSYLSLPVMNFLLISMNGDSNIREKRNAPAYDTVK